MGKSLETWLEKEEEEEEADPGESECKRLSLSSLRPLSQSLLRYRPVRQSACLPALLLKSHSWFSLSFFFLSVTRSVAFIYASQPVHSHAWWHRSSGREFSHLPPHFYCSLRLESNTTLAHCFTCSVAARPRVIRTHTGHTPNAFLPFHIRTFIISLSPSPQPHAGAPANPWL